MIEDHATIIAELRAAASADPFMLDLAGGLIKAPERFHKREIVFEGFRLAVGLTYDLVPETEFQAEHWSILGLTTHPVPMEIQERVLQLISGECWREYKPLQRPGGLVHQWIRITRKGQNPQTTEP